MGRREKVDVPREHAVIARFPKIESKMIASDTEETIQNMDHVYCFSVCVFFPLATLKSFSSQSAFKVYGVQFGILCTLGEGVTIMKAF